MSLPNFGPYEATSKRSSSRPDLSAKLRILSDHLTVQEIARRPKIEFMTITGRNRLVMFPLAP